MSRRRSAGVVVGLLGLGTLIVTCLTLVAGARGGRPAVVPVVNRGVVPSAQPGNAGRTVTSARASLDLRSGAAVDIGDLGVHAQVRGVDDPGGVMQVPPDPGDVGWWVRGARPGSGTGRVVIVGHVNYHGVAGALGRLPQAQPGQHVRVSRGAVMLSYRIVAVRTYPKHVGLPGDLFAKTGSEELVLITCGGTFDPSTGNYRDNIVAIAVPD